MGRVAWVVGGLVWGIGLRRLGCVCGRRLGTGSGNLVVRGLGRAFLCLSVCLSVRRLAENPTATSTARNMEDELECPVCLTLPKGQVHQCNEGHCYCADCWNRLEPRRCPECRQPIQDSNRNRDREARIAALEETCDHCAVVTTRGEMTAHLRVCPQRPTTCAGAASGCGWAEMAADKAAHEKVCVIAVCQRMMEPLQAKNQQLQSQNQQLQMESQQLQARVAALEPLQERVAVLQQQARRLRALEGDAEAGGRQQRQRVGAAPHDAPPSSAAVQQMGVAEAVAALQEHVAVERVAQEACFRVAGLCHSEGNMQRAAEAGALGAVMVAMQAHPQVARVQEHGCCALRNVCCGTDAAAVARRQRAVQAGVLEAVMVAMQAHPQVARVQEHGCCALRNVCRGTDAAAVARRQRAVQAGVLEAVLAAMQAHPQVVGVQEHGCCALRNVCRGTDAAAAARRQRAVQAGVLEAVLAAMQAHPQVARVQDHGCRALHNVCFGTDAAALTRKQRAVAAGGRAAAAAAMRAHPFDAELQRAGQWVIDHVR
eukprot:scaffold21216_cov60-Phaeocystis_antarctica.AAC.4